MGSSVPRRLATAAMLCALVAPLWAAPPAAAQRGYDEAEIRALFDGLRNGTMPSGLAGEECRRGMAATEDAEQLAQVFSAYLDVPEEAAPGASCQARTEEHPSELQSLMRTSYAVLCSIKKTEPIT